MKVFEIKLGNTVLERGERGQPRYEQVARSRPPKQTPWYHVLVDGAQHTTYVAERNLEIDPSGESVSHPLLDYYFDDFREGRYRRKRTLN